MIIESLIKMFSRPTVPIAKPPITGPPPAAPAPGPQPAPGNPGSGFPAFTCNCYCPPVYYPAPPQQTPRAFQQSEVPWGVYPEQTFSDIDRDAEVAPFDGTETQLNQGMVPHEEIPDA